VYRTFSQITILDTVVVQLELRCLDGYVWGVDEDDKLSKMNEYDTDKVLRLVKDDEEEQVKFY
jgi:hypothetical protein